MRDLRAASLLAPAAVGLAGVGACVFVAWADPSTPGGPTPPCPTRALLGITCPGCGSARMLQSLVRGDLGAALHYNAVGLLAVVVLVWSYAVWVASRLGARSVPRWQEWRWAPAVTLAIVAVWWVVRLVPVGPLRSLQV